MNRFVSFGLIFFALNVSNIANAECNISGWITAIYINHPSFTDNWVFGMELVDESGNTHYFTTLRDGDLQGSSRRESTLLTMAMTAYARQLKVETHTNDFNQSTACIVVTLGDIKWITRWNGLKVYAPQKPFG